ncbi:hypothetical protein GIY56_11755 [Paracoccus sp. YIM 132242]|uniref:Uncharacterized protein n=1 Tax=Paracoccus lichenicola TaxID=2665644 RepID=A0A6L6HRA4_9RHOB|nr:hypothetical protein [Paracoccus lichenicola]MTE00969.1 hypothetical protein [Paracoccus lichenicola]
MIILRILWTAVLTIFAGFPQTLRVFALPSLIGATVYAACFLLIRRGGTLVPPQAYFTIIIAVLAFCAAWTSVNFHRKVLLGEHFGWVPRLHVREMVGYAVMFIPFAIITWGLLLVGVLLGSSLWGHVPVWQVQLGMLAATFPIGTLVLLLFVQLVPIAIGRPMSGVLRQARSRWTVFLGVSVALVAFQSLFPLIERAMLAPVIGSVGPGRNTGLFAALMVYAVLKSLLDWALWLSLLTVLYGRISSSHRLR